MSTAGIRAAEHMAEDLPTTAATVAADIRNAVTLASAVADSIDGHLPSCAYDLRESVAAVLAIADALHPGGGR